MRIAEIYRSIQGEGLLTGTASVFVRTSSCNLRCWYCDSPFTSWLPEGDDLSTEEILEQIDRLACEHVVLTGGEPMLHAELVPLAERLHARGSHITIETAGTLYLPVVCDLMSISPKLANSTPTTEDEPRWSQRHERSRHAPEVMRRLMADYDYQLKFVVDSQADCAEVEDYLREFPQVERKRIWLMPQGVEADQLAHHAAWLVPYCRTAGLHYCPRLHIEWFGNLRGT